MSKWSSYEKDKAIADAWRAYLKTEEVAVEVKTYRPIVGRAKSTEEPPTAGEEEEEPLALDEPAQGALRSGDEEEGCDEPEEDDPSSLRPPLSHYAPGDLPEPSPYLKKRKK